MSVTDLSAASVSIPELWGRKALRDTLHKSFWARFTGKPGSGMPLIQQFELLDGPGDRLNIPITAPLVGAGKTEEQTLEGAEEALDITSLSTVPVFYRHAVRSTRLADLRSALDLMDEARFRLGEWGASKLDSVRWSSFTGSALPAPLNGEAYTPNVFVVGGGTGANDVSAGAKLSVAAVRQIRLALIEQNARPMTTADGADVFGLVVHPRAVYDLKGDSAWTSMAEAAAPRGDANPLFSGAVGKLDGVVIYEAPSAPLGTNSGSVPYQRGVAFGAEAFVEGVQEQTLWVGASFDYGSEKGISFGFSVHPRRALEQNSLQVFTAAAGA